jgi:hypothetical protein
MSAHPDRPPDPDRAKLGEHLSVLPLLPNLDTYPIQAAIAACILLRGGNRAWAAGLSRQINAHTAAAAAQLEQGSDGTYHVSPDQLRGVIARAVLGATGQAALDIAAATEQMRRFTDELAKLTEEPDVLGEAPEPPLAA